MSGIVVGIDGSGHSRRALEWATKEAAIRREPLTVVTAHEIGGGYWGSAVTYPEDHAMAEHARQAAHIDMGKVLGDLSEEARPESVTIQSVSGTPAEELISASRAADMIVVGSRGAGGFAGLLMGSVSIQVAQHAHCPVVVIPPEIAARPGGGVHLRQSAPPSAGAAAAASGRSPGRTSPP